MCETVQAHLYIVLTKNSLSRVISLLEHLDWLSLAHSYQTRLQMTEVSNANAQWREGLKT